MLCKHKVIGSIPIISKRTLQAGLEPTSGWLTATRSTTELLKNHYNLLLKTIITNKTIFNFIR